MTKVEEIEEMLKDAGAHLEAIKDSRNGRTAAMRMEIARAALLKDSHVRAGKRAAAIAEALGISPGESSVAALRAMGIDEGSAGIVLAELNHRTRILPDESLVEAEKEAEAAFGKASLGGPTLEELRHRLRELHLDLNAARRAERGNSKKEGKSLTIEECISFADELLQKKAV